MNKAEALAILETGLESYRELPHAELLRLRDESVGLEVEGDGGTTYQVKFYAFWDGEPGGDLRVCGAIDDGGWRAFSPLTSDFIISPDGSFVGE
jgi:hypothetical protein